MPVLQIVRFRVKAGTDEKTFEAINERFQREVAPHLPGLQRREATRSTDGEWVLVLRYTDLDSARRPPQAHADVAQALMGLIDMSTMSAGFYELKSD